MMVILYATSAEAMPLLEKVESVQSECGGFKFYRFTIAGVPGEYAVIISGMGKQRAAAATECVIKKHKVDGIINVGICGALEDGLEKGALICVDRAGDGDNPGVAKVYDVTSVQCQRWGHLPLKSLLSVTKPVMNPERRAQLSHYGAIVDMEGYAVAAICVEHDIPITMLKGVSDMAGHDGKAEIKENIAAISLQLAELLLAGLAKCEPEKNIVVKLLNFVKFEHTIFSLPLLFSGAWLGSGGVMPELRVVALVMLAGAGGRALGMAMNRIFDRKLDALNKRTVGRELPSGKLTLIHAWIVAVAGLSAYMLACAGLGRLCLSLAFVPLIPLVGYSLLKRFTVLCHFGIGIALALAPLCAFIAASGDLVFNREIVLLSIFSFCWISGYDIIYALQDLESDKKTGVHSLPARLGSTGAQVVAGCVHIVAAGALLWLWIITGSTGGSLIALIIAVAAMGFAYLQSLPLHVRFFPASAIAGIAGAVLPLLA